MKQKHIQRKFGLTMAGAFAILALLLHLGDKTLWPFAAGLSGSFLLTTFLFPRILKPVEKYWMKLATIMGFVMTNVLLTLVFFIAVIPTGLIMRLLGKDPLRVKCSRDSGSYWLIVDDDGPCGRPDKPY